MELLTQTKQMNMHLSKGKLLLNGMKSNKKQQQQIDTENRNIGAILELFKHPRSNLPLGTYLIHIHSSVSKLKHLAFIKV